MDVSLLQPIFPVDEHEPRWNGDIMKLVITIMDGCSYGLFLFWSCGKKVEREQIVGKPMRGLEEASMGTDVSNGEMSFCRSGREAWWMMSTNPILEEPWLFETLFGKGR